MTRNCRAWTRSLVAILATSGIAAVFLISSADLWAQTGARHVATAGEARAQSALSAAKRSGMPELYALLRTFPKGADLHMHLSGAVYAETFIDEAVRQGLCVEAVDAGKPASPIGKDAIQFVAPGPGSKCGPGAVPASTAFSNQALYDNLVDSFSMRAFVPTEGINGHDQFFSTFDRFDPKHDRGNRFGGEWLDEVATRAAQQNEQYLEVMQTPSTATSASLELGNKFGWPATVPGEFGNPQGDATGTSRVELDALRTKLLAGGLRDEVVREQKELENGLAERQRIERCGQPNAAPACSVKVRYLYQVLRAFAPQVVFAQTLMGFEMAAADPNIVGLNFVQPEDARLAMSEYNRQMHMLDYLHSVYPKVHISLHAGELALGMVPPAGLAFHIRAAVELGHAERIGHGVDVLYEDNPRDLLKKMAAKHVDVEINLTSNDGILGIKGSDHPLRAYLAAHVPFSLSTDDEGVSRIDLTHEYARAVDEQDLNYADLKQSARDSLEHSFLPGESLWTEVDDYDHPNPACAAAIHADSKPSDACRRFLDGNEKASLQWELERRFAVFEANVR